MWLNQRIKEDDARERERRQGRRAGEDFNFCTEHHGEPVPRCEQKSDMI